jgi:hypothetical protein
VSNESFSTFTQIIFLRAVIEEEAASQIYLEKKEEEINFLLMCWKHLKIITK